MFGRIFKKDTNKVIFNILENSRYKLISNDESALVIKDCFSKNFQMKFNKQSETLHLFERGEESNGLIKSDLDIMQKIIKALNWRLD